MNGVALITHPDCLGHVPGFGHPERPERLQAVMAALDAPEFASLVRELAPEAAEAALLLAHPPAFVSAILATRPDAGDTVMLDADTFMSAGSARAARLAAGGAVAGVDAVLDGRMRRVFVAVRPPGHHAEAARAMGFCLFSSAAIAALHARSRGIDRVAVVDFDVHHGNGTQAILQSEPGTFFASSHQHPCYPGTGMADERGTGGIVVNAPLPPGTGGEGFRRAWEMIILPELERFAPGLLIVSAGFDAHRADPLAQLRLEVADFAWITDRLVEVADRHCQGRLVSLLEGGYDLDALAASAAGHVRRLLPD